jgi:polyribonucleotide nucleotidyltransferase
MSLMDAGVPIRAAVGGIAMGLIKEGERHAILTDIQGMEDFLGDMDFKVAGTRKGINALQMDIKVHGLNRETLVAALDQAVAGYNFILDKMDAEIARSLTLRSQNPGHESPRGQDSGCHRPRRKDGQQDYRRDRCQNRYRR